MSRRMCDVLAFPKTVNTLGKIENENRTIIRLTQVYLENGR